MNNKAFVIRKKSVVLFVMMFLCAFIIASAGKVNAAQSGWKTENGKKVYVLANNKKASGFTKVGKNYYYFKKGVWQSGWKKVNGKKYYFSPQNGKAVNGVKKIGKKVYIFTNKRLAGTGLYKIGKKTYYAQKGVLKTGLVTYKKNKYYSTKEGLATGLKKIKNKKGKIRYYYFDKKTFAMVTNKTVSGRYFGPKGYQTKAPKTETQKQDNTPASGKTEAPTVKKITATCSKTQYEKGYTFKASDFTVTAEMSDGTTKKVTDFTLKQNETTSVENTSTGTKETGSCAVTVTYEGKTTTVTIKMKEIITTNSNSGNYTYYLEASDWGKTVTLKAGNDCFYYGSKVFDIQTENMGEKIDPNIKFYVSNDCVELGDPRTGISFLGYEYTAVTVVPLRAGTTTLTAKSGNKVIATATLIVEGCATEYLEWMRWIEDMKAQVWKPGMSNKEKIEAIGLYIITHDDRGKGYNSDLVNTFIFGRDNNCNEVASTLIRVAEDLGLHGEQYQIFGVPGFEGHYMAKIWLEDGKAYLIDASGRYDPDATQCPMLDYETAKYIYEPEYWN